MLIFLVDWHVYSLVVGEDWARAGPGFVTSGLLSFSHDLIKKIKN
jgi:hypothetical protein